MSYRIGRLPVACHSTPVRASISWTLNRVPDFAQRFGFRIVASLTLDAGHIGITHQRKLGADDCNRAGPYTHR